MIDKQKYIDFLVLIVLSVLGLSFAQLMSSTFYGRGLVVGIATFLPQIIYLGLRGEKKNWKHIFVATLIFGLLFGFLLEFVNEYTHAYNVVNLTIPFKVFGILPLDNLLGHMFMTMLTIVFYQHFIKEDNSNEISLNLLWISLLMTVAIILVVFFARTNPQVLTTMAYPYFYLGLAAIFPLVLLVLLKPKYAKNVILIAPYFFFLYFFVEIFAVRFDYWIYPGNNYVGWVELFNLRYPFEELFFWMLLYAPCLVSYYEIFLKKH